MEVTRQNFQEVLTELDDVLKNATFLSIDGEFTGLNSGPDAKPFDTPAQYYAKIKSGSMDFLFVQFGLSVFTFDDKINKYTQRTYNFYVFPRPLHKAAPDCRFMCQASSIAFLATNGFDFNKLFNCGIPYLTATDEEKLSKKLDERQKIREDGLDRIIISTDDKPQIEEICCRIDTFLNSSDKELFIERCNSYIRRIIHQEVRLRWPNKFRVESKIDGCNQGLIVHKVGTKDEEEKKKIEIQEKEKMELKEAVGLSMLLRKIADSGKLIVGHNMLLDLCHIVHKFFGELPNSYTDFKELLHGLFPRLIDTKILARIPDIKEKIPSSILSNMIETMSSEPFDMPKVNSVDGRAYSCQTKAYHEAGYDAYMTGLCFIAMSNYLGSLQAEKVAKVLPDSTLLAPYINKLLIVILKDYPYINLVGDDPEPKRDHVFHLTFPKTWKISNIQQIFTPHGGAYVSWLSDTTAYVALYRSENASTLIEKLRKKNQLKNMEIQTYAAYQIQHKTPIEVTKDNGKQMPVVNHNRLSRDTLRWKRNVTSPERQEDRKRKEPPTDDPPRIENNGGATVDNNDDGNWEFVLGKRRRKCKPPLEKGKSDGEIIPAPTKTSGAIFKEVEWQ